jgi:hypothetical protein
VQESPANARKVLMGRAGLEPATLRLKVRLD